MWKQVWEHFRLVITLTERVAKHDEDVRELRRELKEARDEIREINRKLDTLAAILQHLNTRIDHERPTNICLRRFRSRLRNTQGSSQQEERTPHTEGI